MDQADPSVPAREEMTNRPGDASPCRWERLKRLTYLLDAFANPDQS